MVRPDGATFLTDFRYAPTARRLRVVRRCRDHRARPDRQRRRAACRSSPGRGRVGFETSLSFGEQRRLDEATEGIELVPLRGCRGAPAPQQVAARARGDPPCHGRARARLRADRRGRAWWAAPSARWPGRSSARSARRASPACRSSPSSPQARTAARRTRRRGRGDPRGTLVVVDIGAQGESGYCSDCTRTFAAGPARPTAEREEYAIVLDAQLAGARGGAAGVTGVDADAAVRER